MIEMPTLGDLYKLHRKNHTGSDIFALVMLIIASIGAVVALYANDYVSKKLSIFRNPGVTGVLELKHTPPGFGTNPDPDFEVNVHYVCTNATNINVQLSEATFYQIGTYVSFYLPFLACGRDNTSLPKAWVIVYFNTPEESLTSTLTLTRNDGALFMVCDDMGDLKWKLMRTWSLDLEYNGRSGLTDAYSFVLEGRPNTVNDPFYGNGIKVGVNPPKTV
jgi:hypothetical protein